MKIYDAGALTVWDLEVGELYTCCENLYLRGDELDPNNLTGELVKNINSGDMPVILVLDAVLRRRPLFDRYERYVKVFSLNNACVDCVGVGASDVGWLHPEATGTGGFIPRFKKLFGKLMV